MESINQMGFYQLENLVLQRVNFTLMDLTKEIDIVEKFKHLAPYYLNFLKAQIQKVSSENYKMNPIFMGLSKESPIVLICDNGIESKRMATQLESEKYINVFYLTDGAANLL